MAGTFKPLVIRSGTNVCLAPAVYVFATVLSTAFVEFPPLTVCGVHCAPSHPSTCPVCILTAIEAVQTLPNTAPVKACAALSTHPGTAGGYRVDSHGPTAY